MELAKINIYNPVKRKSYQQLVTLVMEAGIQALYSELKNNHSLLFKQKERVSLAPMGLKKIILEISGYEGTALYKIYKDEDLMILGEIFLNDEELKKFTKDLTGDIKKAYDEIKNMPTQTIIFTKDFYEDSVISKEMIFSFSEFLGFAVVQILKDSIAKKK